MDENPPLPKVEIRRDSEDTWVVEVESTGGKSFNGPLTPEEVVEQVRALMRRYGYEG